MQIRDRSRPSEEEGNAAQPGPKAAELPVQPVEQKPSSRSLQFRTHDQLGENAKTESLLPVLEIAGNARSDARRFLKNIPAVDETTSALVARTAYLGLTDQLHVDHFTMRKALARVDSPVAKQLAAYVDEMSSTGWKFSKLPKDSKVLWFGKLDSFNREVCYQQKGSFLAHIAGVGDSPIKSTTGSVFAHEVAHYRPPFSYPHPLPLEAVARSTLVAESKAYLTGVHIADKMGVQSPLVSGPKEALRQGTLGSYILKYYPNTTLAIRGHDDLANRFVRGYLENTFGSHLVNPITGEVRPFDLKAGFEEPPLFEKTTAKPAASETARSGLLEKQSVLSAQSKTGSLMRRGGKALGATALFLTATDVVDGFAESRGTGFGNLARVATEWGAFEAGTAIGRMILTKPLQKVPIVRAATIFGTGVTAAYLAGKTIAPEIATCLKNIVDNKLRSPNRPYSLRDYAGGH